MKNYLAALGQDNFLSVCFVAIIFCHKDAKTLSYTKLKKVNNSIWIFTLLSLGVSTTQVNTFRLCD